MPEWRKIFEAEDSYLSLLCPYRAKVEERYQGLARFEPSLAGNAGWRFGTC